MDVARATDTFRQRSRMTNYQPAARPATTTATAITVPGVGQVSNTVAIAAALGLVGVAALIGAGRRDDVRFRFD